MCKPFLHQTTVDAIWQLTDFIFFQLFSFSFIFRDSTPPEIDIFMLFRILTKLKFPAANFFFQTVPACFGKTQSDIDSQSCVMLFGFGSRFTCTSLPVKYLIFPGKNMTPYLQNVDLFMDFSGFVVQIPSVWWRIRCPFEAFCWMRKLHTWAETQYMWQTGKTTEFKVCFFPAKYLLTLGELTTLWP